MSFHLHGPLDPESPLFVGREAELVRIERWLERGDAVGAVLGGRQNGKTSLMLAARERARPWQPVVFVDFQGVAGADPAACARHLAEQIADQLAGALASTPGLPESAGGLGAHLRAVAGAAHAPRIGLFLDELGALPHETRRWLGSALRASFNLRLVHRELGRWTFVLAGGVELCDMAVHQSSPLRNVLDEIHLGDLAEAAVAALLVGAAAPELPASRAADLCAFTSGQPYLTQALAVETVRHGSIDVGAAALLRTEAHNLPHVFHAVEREGLEPVFRRVLAGEPIPFTRLDDDVARLELIGVIREDGGLCRPRNALYAEAARRRYGLAKAAPLAERPLKIRILILSANPDGATPLHAGREVRRIRERLAGAALGGAIEILERWAVRPGDLQPALLEARPHIVHFSGHGNDACELMFEDESGSAQPLGKHVLGELFRLRGSGVRLVVLSACNSLLQAETIAEHVDCAIGMRRSIGSEAATELSAALYHGIASGDSIRTAFESARLHLEATGIPEHRTPELVVRRSGIDPARIVLARPA